MTLPRFLLLLALLATVPTASGQDAAPDSTAQADSTVRATAVADSTEAAEFEALVEAVVARLDDVEAARAAARPWTVRWAWPAGLAVLALAMLGMATGLTYWLAGQRLVASDKSIAQAIGAARTAETAAHNAAAATREARTATSALRGDVEKHLKRAEASAAEAGRELERVRALIDGDDRADRFRDVFGAHVRGPKSTDSR